MYICMFFALICMHYVCASPNPRFLFLHECGANASKYPKQQLYRETAMFIRGKGYQI